MGEETTAQQGAEVLKPDQALTVERRPATSASADEARTEAVSEMLKSAYTQASKLNLTEAESKALRAAFTDDKVRGGAKGDSRILYISHIHVSDRLNDVLGLGSWALIKRSQRAEQTKTVEGKPLTRIYYEGVMLIRGAFVTEAVGVGQYHPNNPKEDYGSALESAMSDCLTRCCKRLGIGSQVWDKGYCDTWLATAGGTKRPITPTAERQSRPPDTPPPVAPSPDNKDELVAEVKAWVEKAKAKDIKRISEAAGWKWDQDEPVEMLPIEKLVALRSLIRA